MLCRIEDEKKEREKPLMPGYAFIPIPIPKGH
jgi:hypothetical protein